MVKILISEDNDAKLNEIIKFVKEQGVQERDILTAKTLVEFSQQLDDDVDICIIDIRIPAYSGAEPEQNGIGILQHLEASSNGGAKLLAISAFPEEFENIRAKFERQGCILANYHQKDIWQSALKILIMQSAVRTKFDFLIFTALKKERAPYVTFPELQGMPISADGLTRYDVEIYGKKGSIIEMPRMGLVDAAITAGKCLEKYSPKLVAMSGICAGFEGKAELGQLLISELAYEYQSGKWTEDGFKSEPYQVPMSQSLRTTIRHLIDQEDIIPSLESDWRGTRPGKVTSPELVTFTSGSAVIADKKHIDHVSEFHRKVAGLDMEIYAIHRAAHLAKSQPDVLCAKVVVDLANKGKDDHLQDYGCYISSKFVIKAIELYFKDNA